jgi:hypothetical protein
MPVYGGVEFGRFDDKVLSVFVKPVFERFEVREGLTQVEDNGSPTSMMPFLEDASVGDLMINNPL